MALTPGTRLGAYTIGAPLGVGGMGEVYRATDNNLGRAVAVKVLPDAFAQDAERLARFEREARTLASLNHPNIAIVHGLERAGHVRALVMELVEGPTLDARIAAQPLPLDEALPIARQIADALEAAHEQGIIHRDLKPANIKVRDDGTVKVLDFGLAKMIGDGQAQGYDGGGVRDQTMSPTITTPAMTQLGVILGTAAYMAPEQARGKPVDARADIWAFGCVFFEMLTGVRAFTGSETTDTLAAVLKTDPDWSRMPAGLALPISRLVRRCLEKDRRKRLQSIGDARLELEEIGTAASDTMAPSGSSRRERMWMIAAAVAGLIIVGLQARSLLSPQPASVLPLRAAVPLPAGLELDGSGPPELALSPDGRTLAFLAREGTTYQRLYVRRLEEDEAVAVPGSETAEGPFFSPDGRWLAFAVGTSLTGIHPPELRKYSLDTKLTQTIAAIEDYFGGYWTESGSIVFVGVQPRGIYSVPANGGPATPLVARVRISGADQARPLAWPEPLPGGRTLLITDWSTSLLGKLAVLDLDTRELSSLGLDGSGARFVPGGYIVYGGRNASLMAAPFDPATRRVTGAAVALMPDVALGRNNLAAFAVSQSGTFVYAKGYLRGSRREPMRMIRVTASGSTTTLPFDRQLFRRGFALSPAGGAIAAGLWDEGAAWLFDLERRTRTKLPVGEIAESFEIAWSPDGHRLAVAGTLVSTPGLWGVFALNADGSGETVALGKPIDGEIHVDGWLPDNVHVIAHTFTAATEGSSFLRIGPDGRASLLFAENGTVGFARPSSDGKWLAYDSTSSGNFDVYVTPLTGPVRRITVNHQPGSRNPVWSPNGRELYYLRDRNVFAVSVEPAGDNLRIGPERKLFEWDVDTVREYAVGKDGAFYSIDPVPDAPKQTLIHLRTNWLEELNRLAGQR